LDEITPAMAMLHAIGFIRAIAGALSASALRSLVSSLFGRTCCAPTSIPRGGRFAAVNEAGAGERVQAQFGADLETLIARAGPPGWFRWVIDLRNTT